MHSIIFAKFLTDWRGLEREPNSSSTKLLIPNSSSISANLALVASLSEGEASASKISRTSSSFAPELPYTLSS